MGEFSLWVDLVLNRLGPRTTCRRRACEFDHVWELKASALTPLRAIAAAPLVSNCSTLGLDPDQYDLKRSLKMDLTVSDVRNTALNGRCWGLLGA